MPLPGDAGRQGKYEETSEYRHPEGHGDDKVQKNLHPGHHHRQRSRQGEHGAGGPDGDAEGEDRGEQEQHDIARQPPGEIDEEELFVAHQPGKVSAEEIERQHIGEEVPEAAVDEEVGDYRPGLVEKGCRGQSEQVDGLYVGVVVDEPDNHIDNDEDKQVGADNQPQRVAVKQAVAPVVHTNILACWPADGKWRRGAEGTGGMPCA